MNARQPRIGLIVNPIAGMGGAVGLKGTDGPLLDEARRRGAQPQGPARALAALRVLASLPVPPRVLTCAGAMGADIAGEAGLETEVVYRPASPSGPDDTRAAVRAIVAATGGADAGVDLLLFAGGDGTARDVLAEVGRGQAVLGIPAGVKMHSAVFGITAVTAGDAARQFLEAGCPPDLLEPAEVMDREATEDGGPGSPTLFGYLNVPRMPRLVQSAKAAGASDDAALGGALQRLAEQVRESRGLTLLGPGATLQRLKQLLGIEGSLLGVDVFDAGTCILEDASEAELWAALQGREARVIVGVVGGQGFLFGRGNQQLSARILARIGRDNIQVVASQGKLLALPGFTLRVDTGDPEVDRSLAGHIGVLTGSARRLMCRIVDASAREA
jgi:predicted polyphosphate/ATP-dependent NAD kinase